jgi:hypothetical protein
MRDRRAQMHRRALLLVLCAAACDLDVLVGRNFAGPDGGTADGGTADGGTADGGTADGGTADGGDFDGGVADSGTADAGPASLIFGLDGTLVVQRGDTATYVATLFNDGGQASVPQLASLGFPSGVTFVSGTSCTGDGGAASCVFGPAAPAAAVSASAVAAVDAGLGWHDVTGSHAAASVIVPLAVTGTGGFVVPISGPRFLDVSACFGTNIMSYAQCTPPSLTMERILLLPDGGIDGADGGVAGVWGQSAHQRNLALRFLFVSTAMRGTSLAGASVTAVCFQGVIDDPQGVHFAGAWEGCFN